MEELLLHYLNNKNIRNIAQLHEKTAIKPDFPDDILQGTYLSLFGKRDFFENIATLIKMTGIKPCIPKEVIDAEYRKNLVSLWEQGLSHIKEITERELSPEIVQDSYKSLVQDLDGLPRNEDGMRLSDILKEIIGIYAYTKIRPEDDTIQQAYNILLQWKSPHEIRDLKNALGIKPVLNLDTARKLLIDDIRHRRHYAIESWAIIVGREIVNEQVNVALLEAYLSWGDQRKLIPLEFKPDNDPKVVDNFYRSYFDRGYELLALQAMRETGIMPTEQVLQDEYLTLFKKSRGNGL